MTETTAVAGGLHQQQCPCETSRPDRGPATDSTIRLPTARLVSERPQSTSTNTNNKTGDSHAQAHRTRGLGRRARRARDLDLLSRARGRGSPAGLAGVHRVGLPLSLGRQVHGHAQHDRLHELRRGRRHGGGAARRAPRRARGASPPRGGRPRRGGDRAVVEDPAARDDPGERLRLREHRGADPARAGNDARPRRCCRRSCR